MQKFAVNFFGTAVQGLTLEHADRLLFAIGKMSIKAHN